MSSEKEESGEIKVKCGSNNFNNSVTCKIQKILPFKTDCKAQRRSGKINKKKNTSAITVSLTKSYHISENEDFNIDLIFVFSNLHVFKI